MERSEQKKFELGEVYATPGALEALLDAGQQPIELLSRHVAGDWGEVDAEDWQSNDKALQSGARLLSAHRTRKGVVLWIITEAANRRGIRPRTTLLLPDEY
ncbi:MAG: hypothetical protein KatS3mg110_1962 [Pirellulaceae bacterium]|nr:MAG: hypothetical protein KatS3mg110_1962 [Pirellulaceae bacterium]